MTDDVTIDRIPINIPASTLRILEPEAYTADTKFEIGSLRDC